MRGDRKKQEGREKGRDKGEISKDFRVIDIRKYKPKRILESFANYDLELPLFEELQKGFRVICQATQKTATKEKIIQLLLVDPKMTRATVAVEVSKSESAVKQHLATLKAEGRLQRIGSDRSGHWKVVSSDE